MRDPLSWSFPIGRFFGITVRVHLLMLFFMVAMVARGVVGGYGMEALAMQIILFFSVLLHEFGHCFAARQVDGDASEILMWPLGGLAYVDVPNTPRANLITVIGGPFVNVVLCIASASALAVYGIMPPMNPLWNDWAALKDVWTYSGEPAQVTVVSGFMVRLFFTNWFLLLFNIVLVGFPLDGGRILQCILWSRIGFHRATKAAIFAGWIVALLLAIAVVILFPKDGKEGVTDGGSLLMLFFLALFIYATCKQELMLLESGRLGEDAVFGYDFSQGYTSLERGEQGERERGERERPGPRRAKPTFWQRWLQRRAERRRQREEQERLHEEARLDQLLEKVRQGGTQSLTDEEKRFLSRVSAKIRNRNQS